MSNRKDRSQWWNMDRALAHVAALPEGACWEWPGCVGQKGYGLCFHNGRQRYAHVIAYRRLVGPVPRGKELDHLCRRPRCFNPKHLEAVTHKVNSLRGVGIPAKNAQKTHCTHGHPFDNENSYTYERRWPNGRVSEMRVCRRCKLDDTHRRRGKLPPMQHSPLRESVAVLSTQGPAVSIPST